MDARNADEITSRLGFEEQAGNDIVILHPDGVKNRQVISSAFPASASFRYKTTRSVEECIPTGTVGTSVNEMLHNHLAQNGSNNGPGGFGQTVVAAVVGVGQSGMIDA